MANPDYLIYEDTPRYARWLKLMLGGVFKIDVPFRTIREARQAPGSAAMIY